MNRRSLRSRLTLLVTVAVAVAIAVCAGACWLIVADNLNRQVNRSLLAEGPKPPRRDDLAICSATGDNPPPGEGLRPFLPPIQLVYADGRRCVLGRDAVVLTPADMAIAAGGGRTVRDGVTDEGEAVRVKVEQVAPGVAVMQSRSLEEMYATLTTLAWILLGVSAVGVVGAASAGLLISRTALRPVGRLTEAVEHIAQTEDLATRIPVSGTDEIARLSTSFNAMTAALAGSRDRQRRLIADAGHELRTPLTSLRTNIELLLRSEDTGRALRPEAKRRLLADVKAQFEELSALVGDLLQLSRPEEDHEPGEEIAFHEVVRAAVARARLRAPGVTVEEDLAAWYATAHAASLERAVVNLLDNAVKFSPRGGTVEVRLRAGRLTVRDHGPGVPPEDLPYVFDRFWRSPAARSLPGSGLGLAIVAQAVRDAGGEVGVDNAPGGGACAWITLPGSPAPSS
ncbi:two-component system sensor histidine kinase MprB [Thermocatellispora tengchongensis]|uniref:histidine kinase n=1 Tax=Thermocatellispora tengchongensis TaxID=1073253 RepID=A0A840NWN7_9ACTN|nr:HAMP domain-containing sensor histidine kinase [Thermocatellispora tengchongensis]MBB5131219.1 two-component system sensor histidine kinase MprB [Thermocatellispora tengchongensis]